MINFAQYVDLPLIWAGVIAFAIFLYVVLDGFDLGIGALFPFAPSDQCRDKMMNSIAPFWDGNETWLVMGGGGLFAAFPLAYAILMPAFYIPLMLTLLGLIFRGIAFEFRFKAHASFRPFWDYVFHFGSLAAGFFQGVMLGTFVQGLPVVDRHFSGNGFEWLSPFSLMSGFALLFGYALLGSTWLIMKTEGETQTWAQNTAKYILLYVIFFLGLVTLWVPFLNEGIRHRWFDFPNFFYLLPIPVLSACCIFYLLRGIQKSHETQPFFLSIALFVLGYAGLAISLWPYVVPYKIAFWQGSASAESQSLLLIGLLCTLPFILGYTAYSYYVFRGKSSHHPLY